MAADLEFRISAELTEIKGALASLRADFTKTGQVAQQAGGNQALGNLERSVTGVIGQVKALVLGFASVAAILKTIQAADELDTLNARLKLVTGSTEEFASAQVKLFDLAQRTRSSLGETIGLYSRIAQATKDAGVGQETLLQVVETINQAVQLSGASTQAAEAALVQLGQGLASGTLRGEELNSILEQTPALADAIAKGLGITRGELRQYGQEGKLTAQQVIEGLQRQRGEVAAQFAQLPLTVGQATTLLKNAGLQLLGAFNTATGATSGLAQAVKGLADFLSSDEVLGAVVTFAKTWGDAFAQILEDAGQAVQIIKEATADIVGDGRNLVQIVSDAFLELPRNLRSTVRIVTILFAGLIDSILADAALAKEAIAAIFTDDTVDAAIERRNRRVNASKQATLDLINEEVAANRAAAAEAKKAGDEAVKARQKARTTQGSTSGGKFRTTLTDQQRREAEAVRKAQLDAEESLLKDSAQRQVGLLRELYEDGRLAAADYFRARESIELAALDRSIAIERQRAAASASPAERTKALAQVEILERQKGDIQARAARDAAQAELETNRQLDELRAQDLESQGRTAEAASIRVREQFRVLRARLEAEGNTAGVALIDKLINTAESKAKFDEIQAQFERVTADLQRRQQQLADQAATGAITPALANEEQSRARTAALAELEALRIKLQELADQTNNPAIVQGAQNATEALRRLAIDGATGLERAILDLRASLADLQKNFTASTVSAGVDALTGFFTDLADGSKTGSEALRDFVRNFVVSMAQIAARALATFLVLQALDALFPGLGRIVAATGGAVSAPVQHSGGMAGSGPRRRVDPLLFLGAPRFHSGGDVLGLKPGEVPAILQEGERVQSRAEVQAGGGGRGTRIVNVIDPGLVTDAMSSAAGEEVILNVIERNAGGIRQRLA